MYSKFKLSRGIPFRVYQPYPCNNCVLTFSNPHLINSDEKTVLGHLLNLEGDKTDLSRTDTRVEMSTPISRTLFKQQLERERLEQLEQQDRKLIEQARQQREQSQSISVPGNTSPTTVPPDVPTSVLQVFKS